MQAFKNVLLGAFVVILLGQLACTQVLLYKAIVSPAVPPGQAGPVEIRIVTEGRDAIQTGVRDDELVQTGNPLDWAIEGHGYFQVEMLDGRIAYTRDGRFRPDANGTIVTAEDALLLSPAVTLPPDHIQINVSYDGIVGALQPGQASPTALGAIELARFMNPDGLKEWRGKGLYFETEESGSPLTGQPGMDGLGTVEQGFLERPKPSVASDGSATLTLLVQPGGEVVPLSPNDAPHSGEGV